MILFEMLYSVGVRSITEEILAVPQKHPLSDDVIGKLDDINRRAEQELK